MRPYVILSDLHFHPWSQFAEMNGAGVNSRLAGLVGEVQRAAQAVKDAGGDTMFLAGDIFHTRGSIEPVVLNLVMDCFRKLTSEGITIRAIPGNHDLATKDTTRLHNAAAALEDCGVEMVHTGSGEEFFVGSDAIVRMIPWHEDLATLRMHIEDWTPERRRITDLIIHAPIDGVIKGIPDHGLDPAWLASLGYRNVFAGHYHHHKQAAPNVYSIGALAHHTWSDVGTKAGFLLVDKEVRWMKSHLPAFIDVDKNEDLSDEELAMIVDQNYARAKVSGASLKEIETLREFLLESGAKGVIIQSVKEPTTTRETKVVKSGESLSDSVNSYIGKSITLDPEMIALVTKECREILIDAEAI